MYSLTGLDSVMRGRLSSFVYEEADRPGGGAVPMGDIFIR